MTRQALRNAYPFHSSPAVSRGYRPQPVQGETLGSVLVGLFMWGTIIAAGVAVALPILDWVRSLV